MNEADEAEDAAAEETDAMTMLAEAIDRNTAAIDRQNRIQATQTEVLGRLARMWGMENNHTGALSEIRACEREARRFSKKGEERQ